MVVEIPIEGQPYGLDFYSFARKILGYSRLRVDPHFDWCYELDHYRPKRSLWLEPRYTYKSTVFTKAYPIWRLFREPNLRILIVNATAANAEAFLAEIVGHYLRNEKLRELYRHFNVLEPLNPLSAKKKSIILTTRTENLAEPSIGTIGALGNLVSAHYDLIIVDDLCNLADRASTAIREKKKRWYQDLVSILAPDGELVVVGTRWHFDDVYAYIITELNPQLPRSTSTTSGATRATPPMASRAILASYPRSGSKHTALRKACSSSPASISTSRYRASTRSSSSNTCTRSASLRSIWQRRRRSPLRPVARGHRLHRDRHSARAG